MFSFLTCLLRVLPKLWQFNTAFQEMVSRCHRSFTAAFKLKVIQLAEEKGKHHASEVVKDPHYMVY